MKRWAVFYHDGDRYNVASVSLGEEPELLTTKAAHQLLQAMNVPPEHLQVLAVMEVIGVEPVQVAVARGKVDQMLQIG